MPQFNQGNPTQIQPTQNASIAESQASNAPNAQEFNFGGPGAVSAPPSSSQNQSCAVTYAPPSSLRTLNSTSNQQQQN